MTRPAGVKRVTTRENRERASAVPMYDSFTTITVSVSDHIGLIAFTRPKQLNSFIGLQYKEVRQAMDRLDNDDDVHMLVLTGSGRFYSSGHDLSPDPSSKRRKKETKRELIQRTSDENAKCLIEGFINLQKPLIVGVNGPAVGVAVTTMTLADVVYASETATFATPFMQLGFCAEGCSSVVFPEIMGRSKANEMLLMGKKLTAVEAERCGLVADILPQDSFHQHLIAKAKIMADLPPNAVKDTKTLQMDYPMNGKGSMTRREYLRYVSNYELEMLTERMMSKECATAIMKFTMAQIAKRKAKKQKQAAARAKL